MSEIKINAGQENTEKTESNGQLTKIEPDYPAPFTPGWIGGVHGEFGAESGPKLPLLRIIQAVGKSAAEHPRDQGALLYHKATIVPRPAQISWYGLTGYYQQNTLFDPNGPPPLRFNTIRELEEVGGNVQPYIKPSVASQNYVPAGICFLVIRAPNGPKSWARDLEDVSVPYEEGKTRELLLPAMWYLRGSAYRLVAPLIQRLAGEEGGVSLPRFSINTAQVLSGVNYVYVPTIKRVAENNSPEFVTFLRDVFGE